MTYLRYIAIFALTAVAAVACGRLYASREDKWSVSLRALGAALLTYLAVQSGLARRLTPDALLPAWGGTAWPGRTALFLVLVVAFMALFATDRGEKLLAGLDKAMKKDGWRWLMAAGMTGLFLLWTWRVTVISFMTNDDVYLARAIANIPSQGLAAASRAFSHITFCAMVGFLYRLDPGGCWYTVYHLAAIALSLIIIGRCVLLKASRRRWPALGGMGIFALLCAGLALPATAELSFTVTPALVGTAAVALLLCRDDARSRTGRALTDIASVILLLLCRIQRSTTGRCLLCFWLLAAGYQLIRLLLARGGVKKLAGLALTVLAGLGLLFGVSRIDAQTFGVPEPAADSAGSYDQAEYYRSIVMDYLIDGLANEQLEAAGLPPELSDLLRAWYFMDERINTETFYTLASLYYFPSERTGTLASSTSAVPPEQLRSMALLVLLLPVLAGLGLLAFIREGRRYWPELACALGAAGGGLILFAYLIRTGRFPLRVFLVVAIPAAVTLLIMALAIPAQRRGGPVKAGVRVPALVLGTAAAVLCCLAARSVPYTGQDVSRADVFAAQWATEDYAAAHPDIYFVTNFLDQGLDPFRRADADPGNMHLWGGAGVTADPDRLYADAFFRDDVLFMYEDASTLLALMRYLTLDFGPVQAESLAQLTPSIFVVDISQVSPGEGYTGWYEQNGMTYYFRDGQALTGRQTIDGKTYTFAPAGAQAGLSAGLSGAGTAVYTTTAYSLTEG